jgi:hypothetical protein
MNRIQAIGGPAQATAEFHGKGKRKFREMESSIPTLVANRKEQCRTASRRKDERERCAACRLLRRIGDHGTRGSIPNAKMAEDLLSGIGDRPDRTGPSLLSLALPRRNTSVEFLVALPVDPKKFHGRV